MQATRQPANSTTPLLGQESATTSQSSFSRWVMMFIPFASSRAVKANDMAARESSSREAEVGSRSKVNSQTKPKEYGTYSEQSDSAVAPSASQGLCPANEPEEDTHSRSNSIIALLFTIVALPYFITVGIFSLCTRDRSDK